MSSGAPLRWPAAVALVASLVGLTFSGLSTLDYTKHLDRQVHDIHCSFIPGLSVEQSAATACRAAMYSPYAALLRERYWGGIPISLFAVGAFSFFAAFALYMLLAGSNAPRRASHFLALAGSTPLVVSLLMLGISAIRLGQFCKTCVGIYIASALLAAGGIAALVGLRVQATRAMRAPAGSPEAQLGPMGPLWLIPAWFVALGLFTVTPALLYASALPNYTSYLASCGKLVKPADPGNVLLRITPAGAKQPATLVVDPLCPTCKAFHQRLVTEGFFDKLDTKLVLFPLDNDCNWMLDRPVHPGACLVSKAVLCGEHRAQQVLEWSYDNQEDLLAAAKSGAGLVNVNALLRGRWPELMACVEAKDTKLRLDKMLRFAIANELPVSTPQMFLGDTRLCDEDTDIGLSYTIGKLAPELRSK
jgi:uncharacterized membrane protein